MHRADLTITDILNESEDGDEAVRAAFPLIYKALEDLASGYLRKEREGHTLQTADLVHEVFLKMAGRPRMQLRGRKHFLVVAAAAMRRYLVDYARRKNASKRDVRHAALFLKDTEDDPVDLLALDAALTRLGKIDQRQAQMVELRFFGGAKAEDIAEIFDISTATLSREWWVTKLWLRRELS
ncbi:MAG: ECF-type sigma factor [Pseudomonadota bacterium]